VHILYVTNGLPHQGNNGVPMFGWALCNYIVSQGDRLTVLGLCPEGDRYCATQYRDEVTAMGAELHVLSYSSTNGRQRSVARAALRVLRKVGLERYYPTLTIAGEVKESIKAIAPDVIVAMHTEALAPLMDIDDVPCVGLMGDPSHLPMKSRLFDGSAKRRPMKFLRKAAVYLRSRRTFERLDTEMLAHCAKRGAVAAHYAQWFRERGIEDCAYYRIPIVDEIGDQWRQKRDEAVRQGPFKIILLGALHGTATVLGLKVFAEDVYPRLCSSMSPGDFEVHIIGAGEWPSEVVDISRHANVHRRGYVENLADELLSSGILVVPVPITLGIRVRILTGLSFGQCIVAHEANAAGIPELVSGENCLLAASGSEMVEMIGRLYRDPLLRRKLENGARITYLKCFEEKVAARAVYTTIMEAGSTRELAPSSSEAAVIAARRLRRQNQA
jgi:hypothetical protein